MHDSWTCIMVENGPGLLPEEVKLSLKVAACELHLRGLDEMLLSDDHCMGLIKTSWNTVSYGNRSGILFKSSVESETGEYRVNFLLNRIDLETGSALIRRLKEDPTVVLTGKGRLPIDELYQFEDLYRYRTFQ